MNNDPVALLRQELVGAAERRLGTVMPRLTRSRRWRPRRPMLVAVVGLALAGSSAAAMTIVAPFGSGTTPDGSTYTSQRFVAPSKAGVAGPPAGADCRRTEFRDRAGSLTTTRTACRDAGSQATSTREPLEVGFTVAPGSALLIEGTVAADIARVTVTGVSGPVQLVRDDDGRLAFSTLTAVHKPVVHAFGSDGRELAAFEVPL